MNKDHETFKAGEKIDRGDIVFVNPATGFLMLVRPRSSFNLNQEVGSEVPEIRDVTLRLEGFEKSETDAAMAKYWLAKAAYQARKLVFNFGKGP